MKLYKMKSAVAKAAKELVAAQSKAKRLRDHAAKCKGMLEDARMSYKSARKASKEAKKRAAAAEETAGEKLRAWEKASKRLSKAVKKLGKVRVVRPPRLPAEATLKATP
jgi:hypothetical protein